MTTPMVKTKKPRDHGSPPVRATLMSSITPRMWRPPFRRPLASNGVLVFEPQLVCRERRSRMRSFQRAAARTHGNPAALSREERVLYALDGKGTRGLGRGDEPLSPGRGLRRGAGMSWVIEGNAAGFAEFRRMPGTVGIVSGDRRFMPRTRSVPASAAGLPHCRLRLIGIGEIDAFLRGGSRRRNRC